MNTCPECFENLPPAAMRCGCGWKAPFKAPTPPSYSRTPRGAEDAATKAARERAMETMKTFRLGNPSHAWAYALAAKYSTLNTAQRRALDRFEQNTGIQLFEKQEAA